MQVVATFPSCGTIALSAGVAAERGKCADDEREGDTCAAADDVAHKAPGIALALISLQAVTSASVGGSSADHLMRALLLVRSYEMRGHNIAKVTLKP